MNKRHPARFALVATAALTLAAAPAFAVGAVVISQVYGAGGNAGATYNRDYIELFNRSGAAQDISGWSVQYAATTGSSWAQTTIPAATILAPGGYYMIGEASGANGAPLPCVNLSGAIAMAAGAGKVALVSNAVLLVGSCPAGVVDFVGYGAGTNCFETGPTGTLSATTAALRKSSGFTDTDNNGADFSVGAPAPCALPTPVAPSTWGTLKSIYR